MANVPHTDPPVRVSTKQFRTARSIAAALFGLVIPTLILAEAFFGLAAIQNSVLQQLKTAPTGLTLTLPGVERPNGNDYALYAMTFAEQSNRQVVVNKQVLKTCVMQVGLAVVSLGLMLLLLGFETGGATLAGTGGTLQFNVQTASTGVVVFLAGSLMAAAGGLMKNEYSTVPTPTFVADVGDQSASIDAGYYRQCKASPSVDFNSCFVQQFEGNHPELKP